MAELYPSLYLPCPPILILAPPKTTYTTPCSNGFSLSFHPRGSATEIFYTPALNARGDSVVCIDVREAKQTVEGVREVDVGEEVLVLMAHDESL